MYNESIETTRQRMLQEQQSQQLYHNNAFLYNLPYRHMVKNKDYGEDQEVRSFPIVKFSIFVGIITLISICLWLRL